MDKFWGKAIAVTGPVAVVGYVMTIFIESVLDEKLIQIFGSENAFYLVIAMLCVIAIALILCVLLYRRQSHDPEKKPVDGDRKAIIKDSKVTGDIVFGDKTINQGRKHDE